MLPNTIIAGAQKSGTTALHLLLDRHPDIFFPRAPQELHFFDVEENYSKGLAWYEHYFRESRGKRVVAQTSPLYLFEPAVPGRIHAAIPHARFIVILRNPVDRAYSHYWHEVKHGAETLSFESALDREPERIAGGFKSRRHYSYVARGEYSKQLARYFGLFPRESFLMLRFDDLARDLSELCRSCADFLNVPVSGFADADLRQGFRNTARMPRSRIIHTLSRRVAKVIPPLGQAMAQLNLKPSQYPAMNARTRERLRRLFEDDIRQTAMMTGLDLDAWR